MNVFVRAVVSGFGFSLGAALYKRVSKRLGLTEDAKRDGPDPDTAVVSDDDGADEVPA